MPCVASIALTCAKGLFYDPLTGGRRAASVVSTYVRRHETGACRPVAHLMSEQDRTEQFQIEVTTPAGTLSARIGVPVGFVPIKSLVNPLRRIGEQVMGLEEARAVERGESISCRKGCAACCRMLVPVSIPEAFVLLDVVERLPEAERRSLDNRLADRRRRLAAAGLLSSLERVAEAEHQYTDEEMEPINRDYYSLRLPCPFLVDEVCSIYEERPSACRELLVTSPAELCADLVHNPVRSIPVPLRMSTALGRLWSRLTQGPVRFVPLPLAIAWARHHRSASSQRWKGVELLEQALNQIWQMLSREFEARGIPMPGSGPR